MFYMLMYFTDLWPVECISDLHAPKARAKKRGEEDTQKQNFSSSMIKAKKQEHNT